MLWSFTITRQGLVVFSLFYTSSGHHFKDILQPQIWLYSEDQFPLIPLVCRNRHGNDGTLEIVNLARMKSATPAQNGV